MKKLLDVKDFGNIDANLDELLFECFEEHEAFKEIKDFSKFLAVGKKGSGKTAIFKKILRNNTYNEFSEGYNLTDYPWYHHELQAKSNVPEKEKFIQSWKYLILIAVSKVLLNKDQSIPFDEESTNSINIIEKFVVDTYGQKNPDIANIFTPNRKLKITSLLGGKIGAKELQLQLPFEFVEMSQLPTVIQDVNKTLLHHVMQCLNPSNSYYICFDELDMSFEKESENYFNSIIGLVRAARDFNIQAHNNNKKINVCVFLRDDIYDLLKFEDKRKITQNYVTRIEWDTIRTEKTLKVLMEKRFTKLLRDNDSEVISWENIFNENNKINGKISKYNYLIAMTCLRPRDMIDLCNNILSAYKARSNKSKNVDNIFENEDITSAKVTYSSNLLDEFDDEIHKHLPEYEIYLEIIKKVGKAKFYYKDFELIYNKMKGQLQEVKEPITVLKDLFEFSIIGNYKIGGKEGGSDKLFRYKNAKEQFRDDLKIIIHPGLVNTLGLKEK